MPRREVRDYWAGFYHGSAVMKDKTCIFAGSFRDQALACGAQRAIVVGFAAVRREFAAARRIFLHVFGQFAAVHDEFCTCT